MIQKYGTITPCTQIGMLPCMVCFFPCSAVRNAPCNDFACKNPANCFFFNFNWQSLFCVTMLQQTTCFILATESNTIWKDFGAKNDWQSRDVPWLCLRRVFPLCVRCACYFSTQERSVNAQRTLLLKHTQTSPSKNRNVLLFSTFSFCELKLVHVQQQQKCCNVL